MNLLIRNEAGCVMKGQDKTRQDKTRQDKTRQENINKNALTRVFDENLDADTELDGNQLVISISYIN